MDIRNINPEIEFDSRYKASICARGDNSIVNEFMKAYRKAKTEVRVKSPKATTCKSSARKVRKPKSILRNECLSKIREIESM